MIAKRFTAFIFALVLITLNCLWANGQDTIDVHEGSAVVGKVVSSGHSRIYYYVDEHSKLEYFHLDKENVDTIYFGNHESYSKKAWSGRRYLNENIPQLNTLAYDFAGFAFLSFSASYERRLKNGKLGFRVPFYLGFIGGGIAGAGTFAPHSGVYYPYYYYYTGNGRTGTSAATGLNLKYYPYTHRVARFFLGPEITIGYSATEEDYYDGRGNYYNANQKSITYGTATLIGKLGVSMNPGDRFNITIDGGAGVGDIFGYSKTNPSPVGLTGIWHIGFSLGINFI